MANKSNISCPLCHWSFLRLNKHKIKQITQVSPHAITTDMHRYWWHQKASSGLGNYINLFPWCPPPPSGLPCPTIHPLVVTSVRITARTLIGSKHLSITHSSELEPYIAINYFGAIYSMESFEVSPAAGSIATNICPHPKPWTPAPIFVRN